jgi:hypothetical protein
VSEEAAPVPVALPHLAAVAPADPTALFTAFAVVYGCRAIVNQRGERMVDLELGDTTATVRGVIWKDAAPAQTAACDLPRGTPVKALFGVTHYQGALQVDVKRLRALTAEELGEHRELLFGEFWQLAQEHRARTLVFDIETVPAVERRALPPTVAERLARHAETQKLEPEAAMGLSPLLGKVVSLAFADASVEGGPIRALVVPPAGREHDAFPEWMHPLTEPQLLAAFWTLAREAETVVTFNGRNFDLPFLTTRSVVHGVPVRVDLNTKPYALRPHLDLYRVLMGERALGPGSLDVVCWALGIESPKGELDGSMVAPVYATGDVERIATYNAADVRATVALYHRLAAGLLRYRADW